MEELQFRLFKQGNEKAFEFFFHKYYRLLSGFCQQFLHDKDKSESIAQEAYIHLWLHREAVEKLPGIRAFLYTSAKSKCLNLLKHEQYVRNYQDRELQRMERQLDLEILSAMEFDPTSLTELQELLEGFLSQLPQRTAEIFRLKRMADKKNAEIAQLLNISEKTVEAHMTRALSFLRLKLSDYLPALLLGLWLK